MQWRRATWSSQSSARGDNVEGTSRLRKRGDRKTTGEWIQVSCLWTSEISPVQGEQQQNYGTIDKGVTSDGRSQSGGAPVGGAQVPPVFGPGGNGSGDTKVIFALELGT